MPAPTTHLPGEAGVWVFILGDLFLFALFFWTYLYYHGQERLTFAQSQMALNQNIGIINTFLLLTSSWFVAQAVRLARTTSQKRAATLLLPALFCGVGFLANKGVEWTQLVHGSDTLATNDFFMFFFMLTGTHAVHAVIGMSVLVYMYFRMTSDKPLDVIFLESAGIFWHLVDLLWIVLFSLLYLVR
jgi:nitric oxide reductase NorE protein